MRDRPRTFLFTAAILTAVAVILFAAGPAAPPRTLAGDGEGRTVTVQGEGRVTVTPDMATLVLRVAGAGATAQTARTAAGQAAAAAMQMLRQTGVPPRQVDVTGVQLAPADGGFRGVQELSAEVTDLSRLPAMLDAAAALGATTVHSITYGLRRETDTRQLAVERAVRDARARAQTVADASGLTIAALRSLHMNEPALGASLTGPGQIVWRVVVLATFDAR